MSTFRIIFENGVKKMTPVLSREAYIALRDSESNRKADKKHMVQMNYSCLPNPDGTLAKAHRMSTTVGMDVDLNEEDNAKEQETHAIRDMILAKKDVLGLLMLEASATKGYHLVFRRHADLSQEDNLKWASDLLGVPYDNGAKDITRVFYTPADKLIYLDDEIFKVEECEIASNSMSPLQGSEIGDNREGSAYALPCSMSPVPGLCDSCDSCDSQNETTTTNIPGSQASTITYRGITMADIVAKYWELYNDGKLPCEGDRNVNTYELAMNLRPICDYSLEKLIAVIPQYDGFSYDEYVKTLKNAVNEPRRGMPYRLRQVLNALKADNTVKATGGTHTTPPALPKKLPPLIELLTKNVPAPYKPAVASAVFASLGAHLHGVKFRYWDNVEHEATFMNVLVAPQSSGKGCIKKPIEYITQDMVDRDKPNREREAEWKRQNPANKSKPKDPRPKDICVQVLIDNLTDAVFNQRVVDADNNGHRFLYTIVDEIEALKKVTSRGTADEVFLLIRKAHDNAMHGQERVGSDSVSGIAPLRWNWNASTTPPILRRFFYKAISDGTVSRLDMCTIVTDDDDFEPVYGIYNEKFARDLKPYIDRLEAASGLVECKKANDLSLAMKDENKDMARLFESEALRIYSYRANVIAWLKGMVLYIAHGYRWSKTFDDFVRWSQNYNLWIKMQYFGQQLEAEHHNEIAIQSVSGPQNLLDMLSDDFSLDEYQQIRTQLNKAGDGNATLRKWKSRGYIEWDDIQQCYHKTELYLNTKSRMSL